MNDLETELRSAVRAYGEGVAPADRLGAIRQATSEPRTRSWQPWVLAAGAAVVAASVVVGSLLLTGPSGSGDTRVAARTTVTVYTVERIGGRYWLKPEQVEVDGTGDEVADAVGALITSDPSMDAQSTDRWEACPWGSLGSVVVAADAVSVALAGEQAVCEMDPAAEEASLQQLAWTVREALGADLPVVLARDGEPFLPQPITPDPAALSPVLIDAPADGATVSSPVELRGTSDTYEANVPWQVLQDGQVVAEGITFGGQMERKPWSDQVELPPGAYTLRVWEDSAETGDLRAEDTVTFTVE